MRTLSRKVVGTLVAGAMALTAAAPATARDRDRDRDGIGAGEIIAGALVLGGIAAVAAAASNDRDRYDRYDGYDRGYGANYDRRYDDRYDRGNRRGYYGGDYRQNAVQQCVYAAEQTAARYARVGGRAEVYDIRDVDRQRNGFEVSGRIAVRDHGRNYRRNSWDEGRFSCEVRRGRVVDLDFDGIRGL